MEHNEEKTTLENSILTIGDTTYKTSGNILFAGNADGDYYLAESAVLEKMGQAIQDGILVNGMHSLLKKIKS